MRNINLTDYRKSFFTLINIRDVIPAEAGIQFFRTTLDPRWSLPRTTIRGGSDTSSAFFRALWSSNQKGIALVIALIMLLVLTLVGLSAVGTTSFETNIAGNQRVYNLAFYTADGGAENFRGRVSAGEFIYSAINTGSYQVAIGGNTCTVSYERWNRTDSEGEFSIFKIRSDGRAPFPSTGRVEIESIIEVLMMQQEGYN
ncbi:MAG: pilus assembly PilX N-terminal domain-containing protein [Thermodesulfobacteriota bacterium]|nr:pilus assembly PilX N-terminal domain-containing protein [Thermodesulfobacteriota bacterium]